jgi:gluconate 2-dehydrogenase gamma chain
MNRRDMLKIGVALPAAASAQQGSGRSAAGAKAGNALLASDWQPSVLDSHQNETVIVLSDLIIPATDTPGAKAALVNRYIDQLLRDGPENRRESFIEGLGWLDGYTIREHGKPFVRLTGDQQTAVLKVLEGADEATELAPGALFFRTIKSATASIYYATEIGFKELNKSGNVPKTYGCVHAEHA